MPQPDYEDDLVFPSQKAHASCDCEEVQRLNQVIDSQQQTKEAMGKKLVELRSLLKECESYINDSIEVQMSVGHYPQLEYDLLERTNAALGESEEL